MVVTIIGKERHSGISSKTGKPYDFAKIHFLARKVGVEGLVGVAKTLNPAVYAYDDVIVNGQYAIEYDADGEIIEMRKADKPVQTTKG